MYGMYAFLIVHLFKRIHPQTTNKEIGREKGEKKREGKREGKEGVSEKELGRRDGEEET